jgi:hypothetical protein
LHDITKSRSFRTGENHAQTGGQYLSALGYGTVADIVRQHVVLDDYVGQATPSEAEVINYADKRVLHDRIVSLDERMAYILDRYADNPNRRWLLKHLWRQTEHLEQRLFAHLSFKPLQLADHLNEDHR